MQYLLMVLHLPAGMPLPSGSTVASVAGPLAAVLARRPQAAPNVTLHGGHSLHPRMSSSPRGTPHCCSACTWCMVEHLRHSLRSLGRSMGLLRLLVLGVVILTQRRLLL